MSEEMTIPQGNELAAIENTSAMNAENLMLNTKALNLISRVAGRYANSGMVPRDYINKPDNCFVACELAARMNVSPTLVMQNLYIVQGRPSWSGQACIALINGCGKFDHDLHFTFVGDPGTLTHGCFAHTHKDGHEIRSTTITMKMAADEGWSKKAGSKWLTMPEQMMMYRAAAFFARVYCPNVLMGFSTVDEAEDIAPAEKPKTRIEL